MIRKRKIGDYVMSTPLLSLKIKEMRIQHNYTQDYVSHFLNMSRGGYAQYEIDRRTPSLEMLLKLSLLYKVGIDTFINPQTIPLTEDEQSVIWGNEQPLHEETHYNRNGSTIDPKYLRTIGNLVLHASPELELQNLSQDDINFLSTFKSLPAETQEDIKLFCSSKLKQLTKKNRT